MPPDKIYERIAVNGSLEKSNVSQNPVEWWIAINGRTANRV